ncbi:MAG: complex I NDUFA9 subunit family protein [Nitrospirae bacterium]|nr:complex I NDUFA9 subunit family protein [Candidatus Manganitrophaceae bacterium]
MAAVFITGATGFVGRAIVRRLLSQGGEARALYRAERSRFIENEKLEWIRGGIDSIERLTQGMAGAKAVIHLAGRLVEPPGERFEQVHVKGTLNVLEAMRRSGLRRLLHMSALGSRADAPSRYHQTKWEAEERVRSAPVDATIFRPSLIFGKEDRAINLLIRALPYLPFIPVPGSGQNRLQPVWVEDVATCFVRALDNPALDHPIMPGRTDPLCGPQTYTLNELIALILQIVGKRRSKVHLPIWMLKPPAALAEQLFKTPPLTRDQLILLQEDNICGKHDRFEKFDLSFSRLEEVLPSYL